MEAQCCHPEKRRKQKRRKGKIDLIVFLFSYLDKYLQLYMYSQLY